MHTPLSEVIVFCEIALKITKLSEAENSMKKRGLGSIAAEWSHCNALFIRKKTWFGENRFIMSSRAFLPHVHICVN